MSLFEGTAPPNVETTRTTAATAPQYLTDYLTKLAASGTAQLGQTGEQLVAGPSALEATAMRVAPTALTSYQGALKSALEAGQAGAAGVTPQDISAFYNPYEQQVVDEMSRQSALDVQRNLLPQLRAQFAGAGGFGSQRYAGATGQSLADVQSNLLGQQAKYRASGFQSALDAALRQKTGQTSAATALTGVGKAEQDTAVSGLKTLTDLGKIQREYEQAKIEAPLIRAQNVAQILRGYTYPTTTTETYKGPASSYGPSPLSQVAGLTSLLASGFNKDTNWGNRLIDWIGKKLSESGSSTGSEYWWPEGEEGGP